MIDIRQTFPTVEAAEAFMDAYMTRFHPCGYGTRLSVTEAADGTFVVAGYRYSSCD